MKPFSHTHTHTQIEDLEEKQVILCLIRHIVQIGQQRGLLKKNILNDLKSYLSPIDLLDKEHTYKYIKYYV